VTSHCVNPTGAGEATAREWTRQWHPERVARDTENPADTGDPGDTEGRAEPRAHTERGQRDEHPAALNTATGEDIDADSHRRSPRTGPGKRERSRQAVNSAASRFGRLARGAAARIDQATRSTQTARVIADLEDRVWTFRRERKIGKGTLRATYVVAYSGYVANQVGNKKAYIRVRVMEEPVIPAAADSLPNSAVMRANIRRFVALGFPGVRVRIGIGDFVADAVTDRHGFATAQLPALDLVPGWVDYSATTMPVDAGETPVHATGQVCVPDPTAAIGVISDVDDTVLRTGMSEGFVAVRNTLFRVAGTRRAVPGMAALYQALRAGDRDKPAAEPSFYYVSTGPWNLYDMLVDFLRIRGFPAGALFLTDWAPQERFVVRSGQEHKRLTIQRLFEAYPDTAFVLIGDSGQKDADTYIEIARKSPSNVRAIIICDVGASMVERGAELRERAPTLRDEGVPFYFVSDAGEAAEVLYGLGLVTQEAVGGVRETMSVDCEEPD